MIRLCRSGPVVLLAFLLAGCVPASVHDLSLDGVYPPRADQRLIRRADNSRSLEIGAVAVLSTRSDLRRYISRSDNFRVYLVRCEGRMHVVDEAPWGPLVDHAGLQDEVGISAPNERQSEGRSAWFTYTLPIGLVTDAWETRSGAANQVSSWSAHHDLGQDRSDLCVYARGAVMLLGTWRTNTVVIPHEAIRAALAGTPH